MTKIRGSKMSYICLNDQLRCFVYLQEKIQLQTARLYKLAGINPLAGTYTNVTNVRHSFAAILIMYFDEY